MEIWELVARERIRDSLARYNWAGDALRLEEMLGAFCPDGALEVRGDEPRRGRQAILEYLGGVAPGARPVATDAPPGPKRIVRHNLTNVRFLELTPERARVASYFTVVTEIGLDHYGRYRDVFVPVGDEWLIEHRFVSTDWRAPDSTMASQESIG
jgi:SnoaL-like domain